MPTTKVLVCLSGGIDSSLTCLLLKEQGYEVIAATFRVYDTIQQGCLEKLKGCCSIETIAEAKSFAQSYNIPHHILDYREYFKDTVIQNFIYEYTHARTPNPCVICNYEIKWGKVLEFAQSLGCEYIATGHYAKVYQKHQRYILAKGNDILKDQSYFLWMLNQEQLSKTLFPLGNYTKEQVKTLALQKGLPYLVKKKESQEICFIPNNDYRSFLTIQFNHSNLQKEGNFVSTDGKILGKHKGIAYYTIGQRKGLGIALGTPYYIKEIRYHTNEIVLSTYEELAAKEFIIDNINYISIENFDDESIFDVKVRYRTTPFKAKLYHHDNNSVRVVPIDTVYAVTPGQSAVFYQSDEVMLGGLIRNAL
ncbi:MAG: tRNA 2-thiouridine(34) synthase MnmA [Bacteroidales bacterium]|nr:tRNA 2-thiouridine(34) synthase MnmA [Bacteroidales bacterium]